MKGLAGFPRGFIVQRERTSYLLEAYNGRFGWPK